MVFDGFRGLQVAGYLFAVADGTISRSVFSRDALGLNRLKWLERDILGISARALARFSAFSRFSPVFIFYQPVVCCSTRLNGRL